jgi:hypothetical protein
VSLPNENVSAASRQPTTLSVIEVPGQEMPHDEYVNALIDGGDAPAGADIRTRLKYASGVQR